MQSGTRQFSRIFSRRWYKSKLFWLLAAIVAYTLVGFLLIPYLVKGYTHDAIRDNFGWKGGPAEVSFNPYEIALRMNDFNVVDEAGEKVLGFSELLIDFDAWSLFYWAWTLEPSHLNDPYGLLSIDETGATNFGKALASHAKPCQSEPVPEPVPEPEPESDNAGSLPRIWIKDIALNDGSLDIRDNTQGRLIEHDVDTLNLDLSNLRTHEGKNGQVKVSMIVGESQELDWEGSLDSEPYSSEGTIQLANIDVAGLWPYVRPYVDYEIGAGKLQSTVKVDKLSIPLAQPYVSEVILMELNSSTLSTDGQLTLTADDRIGGYKGVIDIENFDSTGPLIEEELIGWESLAVKPLDLKFEPLKIDIDSITLKQPYGQFLIAESGETNFSALMKQDGQAPEDADADADQSDESEGSSPQITIGRVDIEDGKLHFEDNTFQPFFVLPMEKLSGSVTNLTSEQQSRSDVELNGTIGDLGRVAIKGAANPLADDLFVDIGINVKNFSMPQCRLMQAGTSAKRSKKANSSLSWTILSKMGRSQRPMTSCSNSSRLESRSRASRQ